MAFGSTTPSPIGVHSAHIYPLCSAVLETPRRIRQSLRFTELRDAQTAQLATHSVCLLLKYSTTGLTHQHYFLGLTSTGRQRSLSVRPLLNGEERRTFFGSSDLFLVMCRECNAVCDRYEPHDHILLAYKYYSLQLPPKSVPVPAPCRFTPNTSTSRMSRTAFLNCIRSVITYGYIWSVEF